MSANEAHKSLGKLDIQKRANNFGLIKNYEYGAHEKKAEPGFEYKS